MRTRTQLFRVSFSIVVAIWILTGVVFVSTLVLGRQAAECLVRGETGTQSYLLNEYGTTDIYCCEGQCSDHGSGILTCGS